jgi:hypothetical protein
MQTSYCVEDDIVQRRRYHMRMDNGLFGKKRWVRIELGDGHNGEQLGGSSGGQIGCKIRFLSAASG